MQMRLQSRLSTVKILVDSKLPRAFLCALLGVHGLEPSRCRPPRERICLKPHTYTSYRSFELALTARIELKVVSC